MMAFGETIFLNERIISGIICSETMRSELDQRKEGIQGGLLVCSRRGYKE